MTARNDKLETNPWRKLADIFWIPILLEYTKSIKDILTLNKEASNEHLFGLDTKEGIVSLLGLIFNENVSKKI